MPLVGIWLLIVVALRANDLPRGHVVDPVVAAGNAKQSYALYIPASHTPGRTWPIVYCLDPGGRGHVPVELFSAAAEKAGFIVAGSNNSRNGPFEKQREAIEWLLRDTHARLPIDDSRVYVAGMSGGARLALAWAQNGAIAGVVACAAGFGNQPPDKVPFHLFLAAGVDDFNYDEIFENSLELARRGIAHRWTEFDGGHDWPPSSVGDQAFDYFLGNTPSRPAEPAKRQRKVAAEFNNMMHQVELATHDEKRVLFHALEKTAAKPVDSDDRRVARRVVMGAFVGYWEQGNDELAEKKYDLATRYLEAALIARPDDPRALYSLALVKAASGNTKSALDALEKAVAHGFRDSVRLEEEPLLNALRDEPRYQAIIEKLQAGKSGS